jgi:hypothetical protein
MKLKETTKNKLFYVLLGVGFVLNVMPANAIDSVNATITKHYKTVIDRKPYVVEVCENRTVGGDRTGDTLRGAIIGGIIGNNITKNVDNGGAVGALLGGMLGHSNSTATGGTQRVCRQQTRYNETATEAYSHSTITFRDQNGKTQTLRFYE